MKQVPHQHAWGKAKGQTATLHFWEIWWVWWGEIVPSSRNKVQTMTLKEVLNRPCTGQVAQNTCPSGAFDEVWGKEVTLDSHVKVGRPGGRYLFVGQPSTSRNEDKWSMPETNCLWSPWADNAGQPMTITFRQTYLGDTIKISNLSIQN